MHYLVVVKTNSLIVEIATVEGVRQFFLFSLRRLKENKKKEKRTILLK